MQLLVLTARTTETGEHLGQIEQMINWTSLIWTLTFVQFTHDKYTYCSNDICAIDLCSNCCMFNLLYVQLAIVQLFDWAIDLVAKMLCSLLDFCSIIFGECEMLSVICSTDWPPIISGCTCHKYPTLMIDHPQPNIKGSSTSM